MLRAGCGIIMVGGMWWVATGGWWTEEDGTVYGRRSIRGRLEVCEAAHHHHTAGIMIDYLKGNLFACMILLRERL